MNFILLLAIGDTGFRVGGFFLENEYEEFYLSFSFDFNISFLSIVIYCIINLYFIF